MITDDALYDRLEALLATATGVANAITIDRLAMQLGFTKKHPATGAEVPDRRPIEMAIEQWFARFPFILVTGGAGVYVATGPEDINAFLDNIRGRHAKLRLKDDTTCQKALAAGYRVENGHFLKPIQTTQQELFR